MNKSCPYDSPLTLDRSGHDEPLQSFIAFAESLHKDSSFGNCSRSDNPLIDSVFRLESYLGTSLLERSGKDYALSTSGSLLLEYARRVLRGDNMVKKPTTKTCLTRQRKLVSSQTEDEASRLVSNTIDFVEDLVRADSSLFFWIGPDGEMIDLQSKGINPHFRDFYENDVGKYDPLHISKLCAEKTHIASLSSFRSEGVEIPHRYGRYLIQIDVGDEVDLVFWQKDHPIACMAFCRKVQEPLFSLDEIDWAALHGRVQNFLNMHWRFRSGHIESVLVETFNLTPRELDVVEWLIGGKSNWGIAQILDISESTVKVHAASVLKKLGVESRSAVSAMTSSL